MLIAALRGFPLSITAVNLPGSEHHAVAWDFMQHAYAAHQLISTMLASADEAPSIPQCALNAAIFAASRMSAAAPVVFECVSLTLLRAGFYAQPLPRGCNLLVCMTPPVRVPSSPSAVATGVPAAAPTRPVRLALRSLRLLPSRPSRPPLASSPTTPCESRVTPLASR